MKKRRSGPNKNNTSGHLGVNWSKEKNMWHAKIGIGSKRFHLGYFNDLSEAASAYNNAKRKRVTSWEKSK